MSGDRGYPQPRHPFPVERILWTLTKAARVAQSIAREVPRGTEVRILVDGLLITSGLFPDNPEGLARFSDGMRRTFLNDGWSDSG